MVYRSTVAEPGSAQPLAPRGAASGSGQCQRGGGPEGRGGGADRPQAQGPQRHPGSGPGSLTVVSLGPGFPDFIVPRAQAALSAAQVVVGYRTYIELIEPLLTNQEVVSSSMKAEVTRCQLAIDRAGAGQRVALVSSGDAGIYGMAGLVLEICAAQDLKVAPPGAGDVDFHFEVVPGVPALAAGAALLGAPLMHDFASISLSDLLTPWEAIVKRLELAAQGDFVIVLYNPKSKKRDWQLGAVRELLLKSKDPKTPVGIVSRAMRQGQETIVSTLRDFLEHPVDMQTIIIVGNSQSFAYGPYMVTPRGYLSKYQVTDNT
jgi:precorrin-3B C17-methyltransferase